MCLPSDLREAILLLKAELIVSIPTIFLLGLHVPVVNN